MKVYYLSVLLLLSVAQQTYAQLNAVWLRTFQNSPPNAANMGEDILIDGNRLVVTGIIDTTSTIRSVTLAYDLAGNELWRSITPNLGLAFSWRIYKMPWNRYMVAGHYEDHTGTNNMFYVEYDQNGDSITGGIVNAPGFATGDDFSDAAIDSRGHVYLAGMISDNGDNEAAVARFDSGGVFRWLKSFDNPANWLGTGFARGIELAGDTALYLWTFNMTGEGALIKYDSSGALGWMRESDMKLNTSHTALTVSPSGHAIAGGNLQSAFGLIKYNHAGDTMWTRSFSYPGLNPINGSVLNVICDSSGHIYAFGTGNDMGPYGLVAAFDSSGTMLWADTVRGYSSMQGRNREQLFYANGKLTLSTTYTNTWIYQWDSSGNRITDTELSFGSLNLSEINGIAAGNNLLYVTGSSSTGSGSREGFVAQIDFNLTGIRDLEASMIACYPNPAFGMITLPVSADTRSKIYDIRGRVVLSSTGNKINVEKLEPGFYSVIVQDGQGILKSRFIKY